MNNSYFLLLLLSAVAVESQSLVEDGTLQRRKRNSDECSESLFDYYFLVDVTVGVGPRDLETVKTYLKTVMKGLDLGPKKSRVSITSYGTKITQLGSLNQLQNLRSVNKAINSLRTEPGVRFRPIAAMNYMVKNLFTKELGYRTQKKTVCVLIFATLFSGNPTSASQKLQENCNIIAVGLARASFRQNRLSRVTSGTGQTINARRINSLPGRATTTLNKICQRPLQPPRVQDPRVTASSATLSWTPPRYRVRNYRATIQRFASSRVLRSFSRINARQTEITFDNLEKATSYVVFISAFDTNRVESRRERIILTTSLPIPKPRLNRKSITKTSAELSWNHLTNSRYFVTVTRIGAEENTTTSHLASDNTYRLRKLQAGTRYLVTVSSLALQIRSKESPPIIFVTNSLPPRLEVARVRLTEVLLRWKSVSGALYYNIELNGLETDDERVFRRIRGNSFLVSDLEGSAAYQFTATTMGVNGVLSEVSSPLRIITAPGNPENVSATVVTTNVISFQWDYVEAALGYRVKVSSENDRNYQVNIRTSNTNYRLDNLRPGFNYRIVVLSIGRNNVIDEHVIDPLHVQTVPLPPTRVSITDILETSVTLEWRGAVGAARYVVLTNVRGDSNNVVETFYNNKDRATVENITEGTAYEFRVVTEGVQGQRSVPSRTIRESTYPAVPETPSVVSLNSTFITIQLHPAEGARSYIVETRRNAGSESGTSVQHSRITVRDISSPLVISRLRPGEWYSISVSTISRYRKRNPVSSTILTEQAVPSVPKTGNFRRVRSTSLIYEWPKVEGAKSYIVYVTGDDIYNEEVTTEYNVLNNTFTATDLLSGTQYEFKLQSVGYNDHRSRISPAAPRQTIPGLTQNIRTTQVESNLISLIWDTTRGTSRYRVVVYSNSDNSTMMINVTRARITINDLVPGTWYNFRIYSRTKSGLENPVGSEIVRVQTVPLPTSNVQISQQRAHSYLVSWDSSEGAYGYIVHAVTSDRSVRNARTVVRVNESTEALVDNLASGVRYRFFVVVVGFQEQTSLDSETVSGVTLPAPPSYAFLDEVSVSNIAVSWGQIRGAVQFAVSITQQLGDNVTSWEVFTESNQIDFTDLVARAWYDIRVYSIGLENRRNPVSSPLIRAQTVPSSPINLMFDNVTTSSISMSWDEVTGASSYIVSVRLASKNLEIRRLPTTETNVVVEGLEPGTAYFFQLLTLGNEDGRTASSSSIREETIPLTPENPIIFDVTDSSVRLEWNRIEGARNYIVEVKNSRSEIVQSVEVYTNAALIYDLESGTQYFYSVSSVGSRNRRNPRSSGTESAYTAPTSPSGIQTEDIETNSFRLMWNPVNGARSYTVTLRHIVYTRSTSNERKIGPLTGTEVLVDQLSPGTEYHIFVQAIGVDGKVSAVQSPFRDATLPDTPQNVITNRIRTTSIRLTWSQTPGAKRYIIYVLQEGEDSNEEQEFESFISNYLVTDLLPGVRYTLSVQAVGALDRLSASRSNVLEKQTLTLPPSDLIVSAVGTYYINIQWNTAVGASSYSLVITSEENEVEEMTLLGNTAKLTDLRPGTSYTVEVKTVGDGGAFSAEVAGVEETTLPLPPSNMTIVNVTSTNVQFSWLDAKGAEGYLVRLNTTTTFISTDSTFNIDQLQPGEFYAVQVYSIDFKNRTSQNGSDVIIVQTIPNSPSFNVDAVTNTSVFISWSEVLGASTYEFEVRIANENSSSDAVVIETSNTSLTISDLDPGLGYSISGTTFGRQSNRKSSSYLMTVYTYPNSPEVLQIASVTTSSIKVEWEQSTNAERYLVEVEGNENLTETTNNTFEKSELLPGTFYSVVVYSVGTDGQQNPIGSSPLLVQTAPDSPATIEILEETSSSVTLTWEDVFGRSEFEIFVNETTSVNNQSNTIDLRFYEPEVFVSEENSYRIGNLLPGVEYIIRIKTYGLQGQSSNEYRNVTVITPPSVPEVLEEIGATTTSLEVQWNASPGALVYDVEIQSTLQNKTFNNITPEILFTATGLIPGETYRVTVYAVGIKDKKNPQGSNTISVQTIPSPPSDLQISRSTTTSLNLTWNDVIGRERFDVYVSADDTNDLEPYVIPNQKTFVVINNLLPGTTYEFGIRSVGQQELKNSQLVNLQATTVPASPSQPIAVDVTTNTVTLEWEPVKGAVSYSVEAYLDDETDTVPEETINVTDSTAVVDGLSPGTKYTFVVFSIGTKNAQNFDGSSALQLETVTLPPIGVFSENVTVTSFSLGWDAAVGAKFYKVFIRNAARTDDEFPHFIVVNTTSVTLTSLIPGTQYVLLITTVGEGDVESSSATQFVTATLSGIVKSIVVSNVTTDSIKLNWDFIIGAVHYIVETRRSDEALDAELTTETTDVPSYTASNLIPGASYNFVIFTVGVGNIRNKKGSPVVTQQTVTLPATNVRVNEVTTSSIELVWDSVYGAHSYNVYLYLPNAKGGSKLFTTISVPFTPEETTIHIITSLDPGMEFRIRIRAAGIAGLESASSPEIITATKPETVNYVLPFHIRNYAADLEWRKARGAQKYIVNIHNIDDGLSSSIETTFTRINLTNLLPGTQYTAEVVSVGALSFTNRNESILTTIQTVPLPPTLVEIGNVTTTSFTVIWVMSYGADSYKIFLTSTDENVPDDITTNDTSLVVSGLSPGTQYFISLISLIGENIMSDLTDFKEETTLPATPSQVEFLVVTTTSVSLKWETMHGAESYEVLYHEEGSVALPHEAFTQNNELLIDGLEAGKWYSFIVYSIGTRERRNEDGSRVIRLQTIPDSPENVMVRSVETTSVVVSWTNVTGAAFYQVMFYGDGYPSTVTLQTGSLLQEVAGLLPGTTYSFTVRSVGEEGQISDISIEITKNTLPSPPTNVQVVNISTTSALLSWTTQKGAVRQRVSIYNVRENTTAYITSNSSSTYVSNLFPGVWFRFVVYSIGENDKLNSQGSAGVLTQTVPRAVTGVSLNELEDNTLSVTWRSVIGAASYHVLASSKDDEAALPPVIITSETTATFLSLTSGTPYSFTVTAIGEEGQSSLPSNPISHTILPGKPVEVRADSTSTNSIRIQWQDVKGAPRYLVSITNLENRRNQESESQKSEIQISSLLPGHQYEIIIFSYSSDHRLNTEGSEPVIKQTLTSRPTQVQISDITTTSIVLSWEEVFGAQSYLVSAMSNDTEAFIPTPITTTDLSASVRLLDPGTQYSFTVVALNQDDSAGVLSRVKTQTTLPANPDPVALVQVQTTSITLRWTSVKGALSYRVLLRNDKTKEEENFKSETDNIDLEGLNPGTWYEAMVFSTGVYQENPEGSEVTLVQTVPLSPSNVEAVVNETDLTSVHLSWFRSEGAASYRIIVTSTDESDVFIPTPVTTSELRYEVENLSYGTRYNFNVRSVGEQENENEDNEATTVTIAPTAVETPVVSGVTEESLQLEWEPVKGAVNYLIFVTNLDNNNVREEQTKRSMIVLNSLQSGTFYEVYILSVGVDQLNPNESPRVRKQTVPRTPAGLSITHGNPPTTSLVLSWQAVKGALTYDVLFTSSSVDEQSMETNVNNIQVSVLEPGTEYRFHVVAIGAEEQRSERSLEIVAFTKPDAVSEITIVSTTTTDIILRWNAAAGAQSYSIEVANLDDNLTSLISTENIMNTISNLRPGTRYQFRVVSVGNLMVDNVEEDATVVVRTVPNPPRIFEVTSVGADSVELVWSLTKGASQYLITITWNISNQAHTRTISTSQLNQEINGLIPGTNYRFIIQSITDEEVMSSEYREVTETTRPAIANNLIVVAVSTNTTTLRWNPVKGARYYEVQYRIRNFNGEKSEIEARNTEITIDDLRAGTWYDFVVFSVGQRGRKSEQGSSEVHVQTVPEAPSCPLVSNVTTSSLRLTWNVVMGADSYNVRILRIEDGEERNVVTEDVTTHIFNLEPGTEYEFRVSAIGEEDQRSMESDVKVDSTLPSTPNNIMILQLTTTSAQFSWSSEKGALRYKVVLEDANGMSQTLYSEQSILVIDELASGEHYSVLVMTIGANNRSNPAASEPFMFQTVPLKPAQIRSGLVTTNQIYVQWNGVRGARSYEVRVVNDDGNDVSSVTTNEVSITIQRLSPGTRYGFYISSIGDNENTKSEESDVFFETTIPSTPTNVQLVNRDTTSANIEWDYVNGAILFTVSVTSNNTEQDFTVVSNTNSIQLENLVAGAWYDVMVTSIGISNRVNPTPSQSLQIQTNPLPPSNVVVIDVTTDTVHMQWDEMLGASSYMISYTSSNGRKREIQTSRTFYVIRNLVTGTFYNISLTTVANQEDLTSLDATVITELTRINSPLTLNYRDETTSSVVLNWIAVEGAIRYFVRQSSTEGFEQHEADDTEVTIFGLIPGTDYNFSVGTIDAKQRESLAVGRPVKIVTVTSPVPNIEVTSLTTQSFTVTWDAPKGANEFEVSLLQNGASLSNSSIEAREFTFSGLRSGTVYEVVIVALNSNDKRSRQTTLRQQTVPLAPSGLRISSVKQTYLNFEWDGVIGGQSYDAYIFESGNSRYVQTKRFEDTNGSFDNLLAGTEYAITMFSVTENEVRSIENASIAQTTKPSKPVNVIGAPINDSAIRLNWNEVKGATSYKVYFFGVIENTRRTLRRGENIIEKLPFPEVIVGGLEPVVNYTFTVVASAGEGLESERSQAIFLETYAPPPVLPISSEPIVTVSNISKRSFVASWDSILNAVAYSVIVRSYLGIDEITIRGHNSTQIIVSSLTPDTNYNVTIKAVGIAGSMTEESFPPAQATTHPLAPIRPFGLRVTLIRATYFEIAWEPMLRAIAYEVLVVDESRQARIMFNNIRGTTANITNLNVLNYYNVTVSSVGMYEKSPPSNPVRVQTRYPIPVIPRTLDLIDVDAVTFNSMRISVAPVEHAVTYIVIVRRNDVIRRRIGDINADTPLFIDRLQQNTVYDVTYQAVGRGGERSIESEVVRTRTQEVNQRKERLGRLIPSLPVDFQVISITSSKITLRWSPSRFALSYRVSVENSRTGITRLLSGATSPYEVNGLEFRETYNVSVQAIGRFFSSDFVQPLTVEIPYPSADVIRGLSISQVTSSSFFLQWLPAPFAISYTVIVDEVGGRRREIRNIRKIQYRLKNLRQNTQYNATVQAVSHDGEVVSALVWVSTRTGRALTGHYSEHEEEEGDSLDSVIQNIVETMKNIPDSIINENEPDLEEESEEKIDYRIQLREMLDQLREAIHNDLDNQASRPDLILELQTSDIRRLDVAPRGRIDGLFAFARELKLFILSNDTSQATADSIANRLTLTLTELLISSPSPSAPLVQRENKAEIRDLLLPIVNQEIEDLLLLSRIEIEDNGPPTSAGHRLTVFVSKSTITSSGFTAIWGRYQSIHRYQILVERMGMDGRLHLVERGISPKQTLTVKNLTASTTYLFTVRPVNSNDIVIPEVVGRTNVTTAEDAEAEFLVNVTSSGYNHIQLAWKRFPATVQMMAFRLFRAGSPIVLQQRAVNRIHKNVLFSVLLPATSYRITATANGITYLNRAVRTRTVRPQLPRPTLPGGSTDQPPTGLRIISQSSNGFTAFWVPPTIPSSQRSFISYTVRLYEANTGVLRRTRKFQRLNRMTFLNLNLEQYDMTVSIFNFRTRNETPESTPLRVDLRRNLR